MKNIFSLIVSLFLFVSCFAQSTKNINSQPNIAPLPTTRFSALDGNGLIKNVLFSSMKDSIQAPLNVQINQKLQASVLSDSLLQIRSDLATKSEVQTALKDSNIVMYAQIGIINGMTVNMSTSKSSFWGSNLRDGWYGLYITSADHTAVGTFTNVGCRKTSTVFDCSTSSASGKNGYILLCKIKDNAITHHSIFTAGWLYTNDEIKAAQDSITVHRTAINSLTSTKANQSAFTALSNTVNSKASPEQLWDKTFTFSTDYETNNSNVALAAIIDPDGIGNSFGASYGDPIPEGYYWLYGRGTTSNKINITTPDGTLSNVKNGDVIYMYIYQGSINNWRRTSSPLTDTSFLNNRINSKADTSALNAEAAARVAGDALRPTFTNLSDSLKNTWKTKEVTRTTAAYTTEVLGNSQIKTPLGKVFNNSSTTYGYVQKYGINADSMQYSATNPIDGSTVEFWTDNSPIYFQAVRNNYLSAYQLKTKMSGGFLSDGSFVWQSSNVRSSKDSVQYFNASLEPAYPQGKELSFQNGAGVSFRKRYLGVINEVGIRFYNDLNQDSIQWANNPSLGHLISIKNEGKLAVKRRTGNLITAYDRVLTDNEVKSKTLTLATSSTPALDLESGVNITYTLTTALAGNFFPTVTTSNIRDGGRYAIRFNALHTGNVFTFPSNVYKKDGTSFGAYAVVSEILDFVAIGSNLYCVNK